MYLNPQHDQNYCIYYQTKPQELTSILCAGDEGHRPCPDRARCRRRKPAKRVRVRQQPIALTPMSPYVR